jgi:PAS domain S-box-containing protein
MGEQQGLNRAPAADTARVLKGAVLSEVNQGILLFAGDSIDKEQEWEFFCECGREDCHEYVSLTLEAYASLHKGGAVVAPGCGSSASRAQLTRGFAASEAIAPLPLRRAGIVELTDRHGVDGRAAKGRANVEQQRTLVGEAIDEAPVLVFVADEDGRYIAVNRQSCEVLGYSRRQLLRMTVPEVAVAPEAADLYAAMLERGHLEGMTPVRCSDGRLVPLRFWAKAVSIGGLEFWLSVGVIDESETGVVSKETDHAENVPAAGRATKRKLVFFYSEQSGRSRRVEGYLAQVLQRRQNHETFELIRVSVERHAELVARFEVTEVPTICIVEGRRLRKRIANPHGCRQLEAELAEWLR